MFKFTRITNVNFVDCGGFRLWAKFLLIDEKKMELDECSFFNIRQIRGFTNGGLNVFTYCIKLESDVIIDDQESGPLFIGAEKSYRLRSGFSLKVDDLELTISAEDYNSPIAIDEIEVDICPHGSKVDEEILKYYQAPNYCVTTYVPKDEALNISRKFNPLSI